MAQKYTVQKKDNPLTLAKKFGVPPSALLQKNKIKTLTAGQTLLIPQQGSYQQSGLLNNNIKPFTQPSFSPQISPTFGPGTVSPYTQYMQPAPAYQSPQTVTGAQGSLMAGKQPYKPAPRIGANSFSNAAGMVNQQAGMQTLVNGSVAGASSGGGQAGRPQGVYDPKASNAKEWRRYWNQQAGGTGDEHVYQMSSNDVWNMKAAQRRRTGGNGMPQPRKPRPVVTPVIDLPLTGNAVSSSLSWRVSYG